MPRLELPASVRETRRELLAGSARVPLDRAVRRRLLELSAGNPLALVELPTALSDAQLQGIDELGEPIPVNGGIERTFGARVARLPERTRQALLLAVAAGSDADEPLAAAFERAGLDVADLEAAATDRLVVVEDGHVSFRHPLVSSVVYQGESEASRRAAHALLAEVDHDVDRRAWHRASAASHPTSPVAAELDEAGRPCARSGRARLGSSCLRRCGALLRGRRGARKRLALAARAAHRAGDVASAARHATAARKLASDPITHADLLLVESDLRMREGDFDGAHRALMEQAERLVEIDRRRATTMLLLALKLRIYRLEGRRRSRRSSVSWRCCRRASASSSISLP